MSKEQEKKVQLVMVVNGTPHKISFPPGQKMQGVVEKTLEETGNTGQPLENWVLRDIDGNEIDLNKHVKDFDFPDGTKLFLNPKAGIGG